MGWVEFLINVSTVFSTDRLDTVTKDLSATIYYILHYSPLKVKIEGGSNRPPGPERLVIDFTVFVGLMQSFALYQNTILILRQITESTIYDIASCQICLG